MALKQLKTILVLIFFSISNAHLYAYLKFDKYVMEDSIPYGMPSYDFAFNFQNVGKQTITITKISSTCDCTIAKSEKKEFKPDEKGVIKGRFNIGNRTGFQEKQITISSDDLNDPNIALSLKLTIIDPLTIKPKLLFWKLGGKCGAKKILLEALPGTSIKIPKSKSGDFKIEPMKSAENQTVITVVPTSTDKPVTLKITILTKGPDNKEKKHYAYAIIK